MKSGGGRRLVGKWVEGRSVLIGLPAYSSINVQTQEALEGAVQFLLRRGVKVSRIMSRGTYVHEARNNTVIQAYNSKAEQVSSFTHLMFIDSDMGFEPDLIWNLLERKKDIVGGAYVQKAFPFWPNAGNLLEDGVRYNLRSPDYSGKSGGLIPVDMLGTGLMLIRRKVLDTMPYPWFEFLKIPSPAARMLTPIHQQTEEILGEDVAFCRKARELGFEIWLDLENRGVHFGLYGYTLEDYLNPDMEKVREAELAGQDWLIAQHRG